MNPPSPKTLDRYGLTAPLWLELLARQGGVCAICKEPRKSLNVDHSHVKGFAKMGPGEKRLHVRGLCCYICNRFYLGRGISIARSRNVTAYLEAFAASLAPKAA